MKRFRDRVAIALTAFPMAWRFFVAMILALGCMFATCIVCTVLHLGPFSDVVAMIVGTITCVFCVNAIKRSGDLDIFVEDFDDKV